MRQRPHSTLWHTLSLAALLWVCGCGLGDKVCEVGAPPGDCDEVEPRVQAAMEDHCVSCHGATPINGAPGTFRLDIFDSEEQGTDSVADRVILRSVNGSMPPPGGDALSTDALDALALWEACRCAQRFECSGGQICQDGGGEFGVCVFRTTGVPADAPRCKRDADCAPGFACGGDSDRGPVCLQQCLPEPGEGE